MAIKITDSFFPSFSGPIDKRLVVETVENLVEASPFYAGQIVYVKSEELFYYKKNEEAEWEPLALGSPSGENSVTGELLMRITETHVQWKQAGTAIWRNLISIEDLAKGPRGDPGLPITMRGFVSSPQLLPTETAVLNDAYFISEGPERGDLFVKNFDASWIYAGNLAGQKGDPGIDIKGVVSDISEVIEKSVGDAFLVGSDVYVWGGDTWAVLPNLVGPQGIEGPMGPAGPRGEGLHADGIASSESNLPEEEDGKIYLVGTNTYYRKNGIWFFLGDLRGEKGEQGEGLNVEYLVQDEAELGSIVDPEDPNTIPDENALALVGTTLYYWNGTRWVYHHDISGPEGKGLNIKYYAETPLDLPELGVDMGDKALVGSILYHHNGEDWERWNYLGPEGPEGPKGPDGPIGIEFKRGVSTLEGLESLLAPQENDGYILDSGDLYIRKGSFWRLVTNLKGPQGIQGPTGKGLTVLGRLSSTTEYPSDPQPGDAYVIDRDIHIFNGQDWEVFNTVVGPKGETGAQGPIGGLHIDGIIDTANELPETPTHGDTFIVGSNLYYFNGAIWQITGVLTGPQGTQGPIGNTGREGPRGYRGWDGPRGPKGDTGREGPAGPEGPEGPIGKSLRIDGIESSEENLYLHTVADGAVFVVGTKIYIYKDGVWTPSGDIVGPKGNIGPEGPRGPLGFNILYSGPYAAIENIPIGLRTEGNFTFLSNGTICAYKDGAWRTLANLKGPQGPIGPEGPVGEGLHILGALNDTSEYPVEPNVGDGYVIGTDVHIFTNSGWKVIPEIKGPKGDDGPPGERGPAGINLRNDAKTISEMNLVANTEEHDAFILDSGDFYIRKNGAWTLIGNLKGSKGDIGPVGPPNPGIAVKGVESDVQSLPLLTNEIGDLYIVEGDGYVWDGASWINVGRVQGPPGQSVSIKGSFLTPSDLIGVLNPQNGDAYLIESDLYVWEGTRWLNVGNIRGPEGKAGEKGRDGQSLYIAGTLSSPAQLPDDVDGSNRGKLYYINTALWYFNYDTNLWVSLGSLKGDKGDRGEGLPTIGAPNQVLSVSEGGDFEWRDYEEIDIINWSNRIYTASGSTVNVSHAALQYLSIAQPTVITVEGFSEKYKSVIIQIEKGNADVSISNAITWWTNNGNPPSFASYQRLRVSLDSPDNGVTINGTLIGGALL